MGGVGGRVVAEGNELGEIRTNNGHEREVKQKH